MPVPLGRHLLLRPNVLPRIVIAIMISVLVGGIDIEQNAVSGIENTDYETITYVFLINPKCDYEFRDNFESYMRINNTGFEKYVGNYYVICMGGVTDLRQIDAYIVPQLRYFLPYDTFLFVYPDSMKDQYYDYIEDRFGYQYRYSALGNSDIPTGVAYAKEAPFYVKHEMAHLATCGTWHDADGEDTGTLVRHPEADQLAWCLQASP